MMYAQNKKQRACSIYQPYSPIFPRITSKCNDVFEQPLGKKVKAGAWRGCLRLSEAMKDDKFCDVVGANNLDPNTE